MSPELSQKTYSPGNTNRPTFSNAFHICLVEEGDEGALRGRDRLDRNRPTQQTDVIGAPTTQQSHINISMDYP